MKREISYNELEKAISKLLRYMKISQRTDKNLDKYSIKIIENEPFVYKLKVPDFREIQKKIITFWGYDDKKDKDDVVNFLVDEKICDFDGFFYCETEKEQQCQTDNPYTKDYCQVPDVDMDSKNTETNKSTRKNK